MDIETTVKLFRDASDVQRYHTHRTIRQQTVGQHSFGLMVLVRLLVPQARKEVFLAAMHHDLPEFMTGDIPAPIKREHPTLSVLMGEIEAELAPLYHDFGLTPGEERLLKWCDYMELVLWCVEEQNMGNRGIKPIIVKGLTWLSAMHAPSADARDLLESLLLDHGVPVPETIQLETQL
jgi:5'-deoxynucleotidase YfbR-like HD superfamily hydrolase